ncbi:MAG: site-specific DNA-methyltransferase [Candidatus Saccharimonadales bacterium]
MAQIQFKGKSIVWNHHLGVEYHELVPHKDKSLTDKVSLNDNLIIQGDNLKALKALLPTYAGKVKCIYIDPPYNTGNEGWKYSDNVSSPMIKDWLGKTVDSEDLTRHDKWLAMMTPRLKLLRELLSDDGAIFVSIDDNEQHHLRSLMDEIFGEENFITNIIWQKKYTQSNDAKYFSANHDFIICYAKNRIGGDKTTGFQLNGLKRSEAQDARYANPDNDPKGSWMSQPLHAKSGTDKTYEFEFKNGVNWKPPAGTFPRYSFATLEKSDTESRIWFGSNGTAVPRMKRYLSEMTEGVIPKTIWLYNEVGSNDDAKRSVKEIFPESDDPFATPKPVSLIKRILELSTDENSIVLDSFAGSGTTAQAVLELNKEDGGNRKFILVEMEDYANKITAERIRRVIKGVPNSKNENLKNGLGGSFSYFSLGDAIDEAGILSGKNLPSFAQMARYLFYTATGEEFNESQIDESKNFIGTSANYQVYLFYKPDLTYLKSTALNLDRAKNLPPFSGKPRLIFAPAKYLDADHLTEYNIVFAQLPFEIYKKATK